MELSGDRLPRVADLLESRCGARVDHRVARAALLIAQGFGRDGSPDFDMPFTADGRSGVVNTAETREA